MNAPLEATVDSAPKPQAAKTKIATQPIFASGSRQAAIAIAIGWFLWGTISALRLMGVPELSWQQAFWYGFPDAVIWAGLTPWLIRIGRSRLFGAEGWRSALAFHLVSAVAFALLHAALDATVSAVRNFVTGNEIEWLFVFFKVLYYGFHTNLVVYTLVVGLVQYVERVRRLAEEERRAAELESQLAAARLASLERQLRPHFLFNALNTVSGLMGEDATRGRRVVRRLGDLLRASLENPGRTVPLDQELELARAYIDIEKARFEDALAVEMEIEPEAESTGVPALILQPLVENAITHGIAGRPGGGSLKISARLDREDLVLVVEDDGPGLGSSLERGEGFGLGLANTRERLEAFFGDRATLTLDAARADGQEADLPGLRVTLRIPAEPSR